MPENETPATPPLKLVIIFVFIIIILTGIGMLYVSKFPKPTELQHELFQVCRTAFQGGIGLFFGLVGGARLSKKS